MLEVHGLLESHSNYETYGDREIDPRALKRAAQIGTAAALAGSINLAVQSPAAGRLAAPTVQVGPSVGLAGSSFIENVLRAPQPGSAPAIEAPVVESLPEVTIENIHEIDVTAYKFEHLNNANWLLLAQKKLEWLGYEVAVDGIFTDATKAAVMRFQYDVGLQADGIVGEESKRALFDGQYPEAKATQGKPLALWSPEEILSGVVPNNGRGNGGRAHYVNGVPCISHQYMRTLGGSTRAHRGIDFPLKTGSPIFAVGTRVEVWWDSAGGGLVIEQEHPSMPGIKIQVLHVDNAFGQPWSYYRSSGKQTFTVPPNELGRKVIGTTGSTGRNGPGSYGEHSHIGLKVEGDSTYGGQRDPNAPNFLMAKTTIAHLLHWGVDAEMHVAEGPAAFSEHWRRLDIEAVASIAPQLPLGGSTAPAAELSDAYEDFGYLQSINEEIETKLAELEANEPTIADEPVAEEPTVAIQPGGFGRLTATAAAPSLVAQAITAPQTEVGEVSLHQMFEGGENSFVTVAVGSAEGTRTPSGGKTRHYKSHIDPGNGVTNVGSFSYQHHNGSMSPAEADQAQLDRLQRQLDVVLPDAKELGLELTLLETTNLIDLLNQSPWGGGWVVDSNGNPSTREVAYLQHLHRAKTEMGKTGSAAVEHARIESYKRSDSGKFWADGLCFEGECGTWRAVHADQSRRMREIDKAIQVSQFSGQEIVLPGNQPAIETPIAETPVEPSVAEAPEPPVVGHLHGEEIEVVPLDVAPQAPSKVEILQKVFTEATGQSFKPKSEK